MKLALHFKPSIKQGMILLKYETKDGYRKLKRWSWSQYDIARDLIFAQFEKGLKSLIKEIEINGI